MDKLSQKKFLGITTLGEKGQVVIPAEARTALSLVKGEKLVVMSPHDNAIVHYQGIPIRGDGRPFHENLASVRKMIKAGGRMIKETCSKKSLLFSDKNWHRDPRRRHRGLWAFGS